MLGARLCRLCTLSQLKAEEREVEENGGWGVAVRGCQSRPCGKTPQEEEEDTQQAAREQY